MPRPPACATPHTPSSPAVLQPRRRVCAVRVRAHPERGGRLEREQVGVEGDEAERVLAGDQVPRDALLGQHALARDRAPRQEERRVLVAAAPAALPARAGRTSCTISRSCAAAGRTLRIRSRCSRRPACARAARVPSLLPCFSHARTRSHAAVRRGRKNAAYS